jgi:hypothetical protein
MSTKSTSAKRLDATRTTAARPPGTSDPEGCSRKHTFNPADFAVKGLETPEDISKLRDELIAFYRPADSQELFAVERIVMAHLSLRRCAALEDGLFANLGQSTQDVNYRLAVGFSRLGGSSVWTTFLRYQAQSHDSYRWAIQMLESLRALRHKLPRKSRPQLVESPPVRVQ